MESALPVSPSSTGSQPALSKPRCADGAGGDVDGENGATEFELLLRERQEASKRGKVVVMLPTVAGAGEPQAAAAPAEPLPAAAAALPGASQAAAIGTPAGMPGAMLAAADNLQAANGPTGGPAERSTGEMSRLKPGAHNMLGEPITGVLPGPPAASAAQVDLRTQFLALSEALVSQAIHAGSAAASSSMNGAAAQGAAIPGAAIPGAAVPSATVPSAATLGAATLSAATPGALAASPPAPAAAEVTAVSAAAQNPAPGDPPAGEALPGTDPAMAAALAHAGRSGPALAAAGPAKSESLVCDTRAQNWVGRLAEGIAHTTRQGNSSLHIELRPEHLGGIDMDLARSPEGLRISITTEQALTGRLLEEQLASLRQTLAQSGIQLAQLDIRQQAGGQSWHHPRQPQPWQPDNPARSEAPAPETAPAQAHQSSEVDYRI